MNQAQIDAMIRAQLGMAVPMDKAVNRTPPDVVEAMLRVTRQATGLDGNASLSPGNAPAGPEDLRAAR